MPQCEMCKQSSIATVYKKEDGLVLFSEQCIEAYHKWKKAHPEQWSRIGRHLDAKIQMDWLEGECDEPNMRVFYIE